MHSCAWDHFYFFIFIFFIWEESSWEGEWIVLAGGSQQVGGDNTNLVCCRILENQSWWIFFSHLHFTVLYVVCREISILISTDSSCIVRLSNGLFSLCLLPCVLCVLYIQFPPLVKQSLGVRMEVVLKQCVSQERIQDIDKRRQLSGCIGLYFCYYFWYCDLDSLNRVSRSL